ncbi:MAG: DUF4091 domain-containing protein [Victivallaceae bacterium]|nr:DUF4091 domain-containing protein [Victivallaceae bacterium]
MISDNDTTYRLVDVIAGDALLKNQERREEYRRLLESANLNIKGRYVLLYLIPRGSFIVCDEVEIIRGNSTPQGVNPEKYPSFTLKQIESPKGIVHRLKESAELNLQVVQNNLKTANISAERKNAIKQELEKLARELSAKNSLLMTKDQISCFAKKLAAISSQINRNLYPETPYILWYKNPWENFSPYELPCFSDSPLQKIPVFMGRNDGESTAFMVTNTSDRDLALRVDVKGENNAIDITVRYSFFVLTAGGSLLTADALPLALTNGINKVVIPQGQTRQIWLTLKTGKTIKPGEYKLKIVTSSNAATRPVLLNIKVYPITLPDRSRIATCTWDWTHSPEVNKNMTAAYADLLKHRITFFRPCITDNLPLFAKDGSIISPVGNGIDAALSLYGSKGFFLLFWYWENTEQARVGFNKGLKYFSPEWKNALRNWLNGVVAHLKKRGLGYDDFAMYPIDEPNLKEKKEFFMRVAPEIKKIDPKLKIFVTMNFRDWSLDDLKKTLPFADIYCFCPSWKRKADPENLAFLKKANKTILAYNSPVSHKNESPTVGFRLIFWQAWSWGIDGYGTWRYYNKQGSVWDDFDGGRPDETFIYLGSQAPFKTSEQIIPSKRWEAWREGIEDWDYLQLLNDLIIRAKKQGIQQNAVNNVQMILAKTVAGLVKKADGTPVSAVDKVDPGRLDEARRKIMEQIVRMKQIMEDQ